MLAPVLATLLAAAVAPTTGGGCDNAALTDHAALLVIVPHPDDEVLGFGGLIQAYLQRGRPVQVVVVTDGATECRACAFWNSAGESDAPCSDEALAAFADARREESTAGVRLLGGSEPIFLGYPDRGLTSALHLPELPLDRLSCATGARVATPLTGAALRRSLVDLLAALPESGLVATTEPDADHPDHAALGQLVQALDESLPHPHLLLLGRVHPRRGTRGAECAYPLPPASDCGCVERGPTYYDTHPGLLETLRRARSFPMAPEGRPPGETVLRLCLSPAAEALKGRALAQYATQIGDRGRAGRTVPEARRGYLDCIGFLPAFVRTTELYQVGAGGTEVPDAP